MGRAFQKKLTQVLQGEWHKTFPMSYAEKSDPAQRTKISIHKAGEGKKLLHMEELKSKTQVRYKSWTKSYSILMLGLGLVPDGIRFLLSLSVLAELGLKPAVSRETLQSF